MPNAAFTEYTSTPRATILVADDHVLVRDGIKVLVAEILAGVRFLEADDGDSLFQALGLSPPVRLALVDLRMPGMNGGMRLIEIARCHPTIPLVVVSAVNVPEIVRRVMKIPSVRAFVPKSGNAVNMRAAIEVAMEGRKLPFESIHQGVTPPKISLTPRQVEIRTLLRQGLSNKMIAGTLGISEGTVKNHITDIFKALNATNRTQAAHLSFEAE